MRWKLDITKEQEYYPNVTSLGKVNKSDIADIETNVNFTEKCEIEFFRNEKLDV